MSLSLLLGSFALVVQKLATPVSSGDLYFHVRMGQEFLSSWTPWDPGSVSRFATAEWVPTQWLGQVLYGFAETQFGLPGVAWLAGALILAFVLTLYVTTRQCGPLVASAFIVPVTLMACSPALSGRPQVFSYIFAALMTAAWLRTRATGRVAWGIVPLTWAWAMLHGMWVVSLAISTVAAAGLVLDREAVRPPRRDLVAVPLLSALAVVITPVGPALVPSAWRVSTISHYFEEWGPVDFTQLPNLVAAAAIAVLLVTAIRSRRPMPWSQLVLVLLAGAFMLYSSRTVPVAASMLAPLLAAWSNRFVPRRAKSAVEVPVVATGFAASLVLLALVVPSVADLARHDSNQAHQSVAALPPGTGLLNEWNEGGYDMWAHPDLDIVMHGYGDMFTDEELARNARLMRLDPGWYASFVELRVEHALLREDSRLTTALTQELGWQVVAQDDGLVHLRAPGG